MGTPLRPHLMFPLRQMQLQFIRPLLLLQTSESYNTIRRSCVFFLLHQLLLTLGGPAEVPWTILSNLDLLESAIISLTTSVDGRLAQTPSFCGRQLTTL